ncbi:hypothetical protein D3C77_340220 [compost metagenome]
MTRRTALVSWSLAFVVVSLLGAGLGRLFGSHASSLDLWCTGESAHQVQSQRPSSSWLTTRFRLDLRTTGVSHMRMVAQLIDLDSGTALHTLRRNTAFHVQQQGHRLQITVVRSASGEAESTKPELAGTLGLFIFRSNNSLSYWIRSLSKTRYLFDDGNDMFILCSKR